MKGKVSTTLSHDMDRVIYATLARMTHGLSPASMFNAYVDWIIHLGFSPGKQAELASKATSKGQKLLLHVMLNMWNSCKTCIEPLPQDKRFDALEWKRWPFDAIYQTFLLQQQWWHYATTDVPGVGHHHENMINFASRQMLDVVSPSNFLWSNPEVLARTFTTGGLNLLQGFRNWTEDVSRHLAGKPQLDTGHFRPGHEVAVTPGKVVYKNHLIELIQYDAQTPTTYARPLLMVPSWIMKFYILDLSPHNSMVRYLVNQGYTVFMVSWRNPDAGDRSMGMDDYLMNGVMAAIDAVSRTMPRQPILGVGYCLGGTLLAIAAAWMARQNDKRMQALTLLASQVDFTEPGELALFIDDSQLAFLDGVMSDQGYLDGKQMAGAFALLNQRDLLFSKIVRDYLMGEREPMRDLTAWNADATRMPYRQHSHYLHSLYRHNDFAEGRYLVEGYPVVLGDLELPFFCLGTQRDTVSPWRSVYKINLLTSSEATFCLTSGGHNAGVVNPPVEDEQRSFQISTRKKGAKYIDPDTWSRTFPSHRGSWWPAWERWLQSQAGQRVKAPQIKGTLVGGAALKDAPGTYVLVP